MTCTTQAEEQACIELVKTQAKLNDLRLLLEAYLTLPSSDGIYNDGKTSIGRRKLRAAIKDAIQS